MIRIIVTLAKVVPAAVWYTFFLLCGILYAASQTGNSLLWPYVALYFVIAAGFLYCYSIFQPIDVFNPMLGLFVLLFLYSFASGLYVDQFGVMYFGEAASSRVQATYYLACTVGLLGLGFGCLLGINPRESTAIGGRYDDLGKGAPNPQLLRKAVICGIVALVLFWPWVSTQFNFLNVSSYAERALSMRVERMGNAAAGPQDVFLSQIPAMYILSAATLLIFGAKRLWARAVGVGVCGSYLVANTLAGWRGVVVTGLLIPVVYYHYRIKHISVRAAILGGALVYLFVNGLSVVRFTSDPTEMILALRENVSGNGLAFARLTASGELVVAHNLMRLISGIEAGEAHFTYGRSIITELAVLIPKSIYPNRPLPLSEQFVETFYPGVLEAGGGYGFFILQDGYWAFGIPGVFLSMVFYGWITQRIYSYFVRRRDNDIAVLCYSAVYAAIVMAAVRTGMIGSLKAAAVNAIPFVFLSILTRTGVVRRTDDREVAMTEEVPRKSLRSVTT